MSVASGVKTGLFVVFGVAAAATVLVAASHGLTLTFGKQAMAGGFMGAVLGAGAATFYAMLHLHRRQTPLERMGWSENELPRSMKQRYAGMVLGGAIAGGVIGFIVAPPLEVHAQVIDKRPIITQVISNERLSL